MVFGAHEEFLDGAPLSMPLLLLLLLTVLCMPFDWPEPGEWVGTLGGGVARLLGLPAPGQEPLIGSVLLTWLSMATLVGSAAFVGQRFRLHFRRGQVPRERLLRSYASWRLYHLIGLFVIYGAALHYFGWGWTAQGARPSAEPMPDPLPCSALLVLAPFLTALVLSWACFYDADKALHESAPTRDPANRYWSRWTSVAFRARQNLALVFIPVLLLVVVNDLHRFLPLNEEDGQEWAGLVTFVAALGVFICIPWVIRLILGLKPLAEGPLRLRLTEAGRRLRVRCSNILLWNTRGGVANAMVIGILPFLRYVVLTDRLVSDMTADEVEAVFGHEAGHVKHRHMLYYLVFLVVSFLVLFALWQNAGGEAWRKQATREHLAAFAIAAMLGSYVFVVFGFLSRRCERQADIYGCRAVSCGRNDCDGHSAEVELLADGRGLCPTGIRTFISALEKVAFLNGISRDRPGWLQSWQHSTIARRVDFLQRVLTDRTVETSFQRRVSIVKWVLFLALGVLLLILWRDWNWADVLAF
jgi:Zn-dependent protease with chaperone function